MLMNGIEEGVEEDEKEGKGRKGGTIDVLESDTVLSSVREVMMSHFANILQGSSIQ